MSSVSITCARYSVNKVSNFIMKFTKISLRVAVAMENQAMIWRGLNLEKFDNPDAERDDLPEP